MTIVSISDRVKLAQKLLSLKQSVAQATTNEFFRIHPEWEARYGERGRRFCTEDCCFHIEFLAGAIEADAPRAFADYVQWTVRMLGARNMDAHSMEENLAQIENHISPLLQPADREVVAAFLAAGRQACAQPEPVSAAQAEHSPLGLTQRAFLAAILSGHRRAALTVVEEALRNGALHIDIYVDVISEALHAIGSLWEQNKISVAQEHMATAIAQYVVAMIYPRIASAGETRGSMVVTGVCGELHQIGPNLVADAMEANGWSVRFLGTNLPNTTILATIEDVVPKVLCISTTLVANLPSAAELIRDIRTKMEERAPRIVLGGAAYRFTPQFAQDIGAAEVILDLRQALQTV